MQPFDRVGPRGLLPGAALWLGVALSMAAAGCAVAPPRSELADAVGASQIPPEVLRVRVRSLAGPFSGQLEATADEIAGAAGDAATRRRMTRFKQNAVPAIQSALFQPDPVAAIIDTWALLAQLQGTVGRGVQGLGPAALETAQQRFGAMEDELEALWRELTGRSDVSEAARRVHAWAAEHPLTESVAAREGTADLLASLTTRSRVRPLGAAAALLEDTQDLTARADLLATWLPKEARWQAELLLLDVLQDPDFRPDLPEAQRLALATERVLAMLADVPDLVARERTIALAALNRERLDVQAFLTAEREALMADLEEARAATVADLGRGREAVTADAERVSGAAIDRTFDRLDRLTARVLLLAGLGLAAFFLLQALLVVLLVRALRRAGRPSEPPPVRATRHGVPPAPTPTPRTALVRRWSRRAAPP